MKMLFVKVQFLANKFMILLIAWVYLPFVLFGEKGLRALGFLVSSTLTFPVELIKVTFMSTTTLKRSITVANNPESSWFIEAGT